jgi:hypothetical protein
MVVDDLVDYVNQTDVRVAGRIRRIPSIAV